MTTKKYGKNFNVCRNVGSSGSPSWVRIRVAKDVKLNLEAITFDSSDRSSLGETVIPVRYKAEPEFDAIWDNGTALLALRAAFIAGTPIDLAVLDAIPGTSGWGVRAEFAVTAFPVEFPLKDGQKIKIGLKPHGNWVNLPPAFYTDGTLAEGTADPQAAKKLGTKGSLNTAGGTPINSIMDMKFSIEPAALFDASDRTSDFEQVIPTRFKYAVDGEFIWDSTDTNLVAIRDAFVGLSPIELFAMDGPYATTGSWGIHSDWAVTKFPLDGALKDGQKVKFELQPHGNGATAPVLVTIA